MFLHRALNNNLALLQAAQSLHQSGQIPPGSFVLDLDAVRYNARLQAEAAAASGLELYFMTKQIARNPLAAKAIAEAGIRSAVTIDAQEAFELADHGITIGHVGHLVQPPQHLLPGLLSLRPDYVTVFSIEKAEQVAAAAAQEGIVQPVLLRIVDAADEIYPGQEGGLDPAGLETSLQRLTRLSHIRVAGVTSFPCLLWNPQTRKAEPTANFRTIMEAARTLQRLGVAVRPVVNAPSLTTASTIPLLAQLGATQGEPGHSLTGTTPLHAALDEPEQLALVYVSEISHLQGGLAYAFGGGYYRRGHIVSSLVGRAPEDIGPAAQLPFLGLPDEAIDYYLPLEVPAGRRVRVGDTALFAFRAQAFTSRSLTAVVEGISQGRPSVVAVFDRRNVPFQVGAGLAPRP